MRICLIGVTHFCHNPRLLREADSWAEAGHDVRVVTPSFSVALAQQDQRQLARRQWHHQTIDYLPVGWIGKTRSTFIRGRRRLADELQQRSLGGRRLAEYSYTAALPELIRIASQEHADWFIAHAQAALPIAVAAAKRWKARVGFDCEDLLSEHGTDPPEIVRQIEKTYLPNCNYVSAPSQGIADWLQRAYGIKPPLVLYNLFPLSLSEGMVPPADRPATPVVRLHWFSQTIGLGRGIEEAIEACGMLKRNVELHLRGNPTNGYEPILRAMAERLDVDLKLHPQADHDHLIKTMDRFDVGLALEREENRGAALTVSNKLGSYLLAGLAIAATDTPGQRELLQQIPTAGFLYPSGKPKLLADGLGRWIDNRKELKASQQAAWDSARKRFCWDIEAAKLVPALS